jgi:hypothetical protein
VIDVLSTLIHEATHYWQNKYVPSYNNDLSTSFTIFEIMFNSLGIEQQAVAVQVHFILAWQLHHGAETISIHGIYSTDPNNPYVGPINRFSLLGQRMLGSTTLSRSGARWWMGFFAPLMTEIRFPATTWGAIKTQ